MTIAVAQTHDWVAGLPDDARATLAVHSRDATEFRDLGLMLGLIEIEPDGSAVLADPWDADLGVPMALTQRASRR